MSPGAGSEERRQASSRRRAGGVGYARFIAVGGFPGSGKSTALAQLARHFSQNGERVGLITGELDRTRAARGVMPPDGLDFPADCVHARFPTLLDACRNLSHHRWPKVFLCESPGSAAELLAGAGHPLPRIYRDHLITAPLSVLVDPLRATGMLGPNPSFSRPVVYLYRKQLEEARLIIISKADLLDRRRLEVLQRTLREQFPAAPTLALSARDTSGLDQWIARLVSEEHPPDSALEMDYDRCNEAVSRLGWLNCAIRVSGDAFEGQGLLMDIARRIQSRLTDASFEIAHLKMWMTCGEAGGASSGELVSRETTKDACVASLSLARNDAEPELHGTVAGSLRSGAIVVDLRAEAEVELLDAAVIEAVERCARQQRKLNAEIEHVEHVRPTRADGRRRATAAKVL